MEMFDSPATRPRFALGGGNLALITLCNLALINSHYVSFGFKTAFLKLDEALKICNRRVNALENVRVFQDTSQNTTPWNGVAVKPPYTPHTAS